MAYSKNLTNKTKEELIQQLQSVQEQLDREKQKNNGLAEELHKTKDQILLMQATVEQEEEFISNKLLKRLEKLNKEKQSLANEIEQEEEFLTNSLQKRLESLNKEKVDLENQLEAEQEYIVNQLKKQLEHLNAEKGKLNRDKVNLENQLEAEQEYLVNKLQKQVENVENEKKKLQQEKSDMLKQVNELQMSVKRLNREKVNLENAVEIEEENIINHMQRQLDNVVKNYKFIEKKLEERGVSLSHLGISESQAEKLRRSSFSYGTFGTNSFRRSTSLAERERTKSADLQRGMSSSYKC